MRRAMLGALAILLLGCATDAEKTPTPSDGERLWRALDGVDGRYGPFWGCTNYGSKPSCRYKRDIESIAICRRA